MAQRVQVLTVSDLSGTDLGTDGVTVSFGYQGVSYEIDLSESEVQDFDKAMAKYIEAGRRVGGRRSGGKAPGRSRNDLGKVREWARANGHTVSDRGRIPRNVTDAYDAAH